ITLFFNFIYGLETLALLILLINIAFKTGKEFNRETVGELAEKIVKDKSKKPGKNYSTLSNEEIIEELKFIFGEFRPSEEEITRETGI
ncbi:MAG TPA: hypothetical protein VFJ43_05995, partial [Bacteroidia bacterium]|nr:hypothetical protein [Bacteroidia bacterium]